MPSAAAADVPGGSSAAHGAPHEYPEDGHIGGVCRACLRRSASMCLATQIYHGREGTGTNGGWGISAVAPWRQPQNASGHAHVQGSGMPHISRLRGTYTPPKIRMSATGFQEPQQQAPCRRPIMQYFLFDIRSCAAHRTRPDVPLEPTQLPRHSSRRRVTMIQPTCHISDKLRLMGHAEFRAAAAHTKEKREG